MVYLRLYSTLTKYLRGTGVGEAVPVEVQPGASISQLIAHLGITEGEIFLVSVNSRVEDHDYILCEGDEVSLFGPIAGGTGPLARPTNEGGDQKKGVAVS